MPQTCQLCATDASGPAYVCGPRGGYLLGFVAAAFITGWLAERGWDRGVATTALAMLAGTVAIYAAGPAWLSLLAGARTLALGLTPFIAGNALRLANAAAALPTGRKLLSC